MIELPKRSVTRFFVPLIDVLILLFCIFLLMPFFSQPTNAENPEQPAPPSKEIEAPLPQDVQTLQKDLQQARRELGELQGLRSNLADRLNILVLEIDSNNGKLYYYREKERVDVPDQRSAEDVIDRHKRRSGTREPFFLILMPREGSGDFPLLGQLDSYRSWFKGVQFRIDGPW